MRSGVFDYARRPGTLSTPSSCISRLVAVNYRRWGYGQLDYGRHRCGHRRATDRRSPELAYQSVALGKSANLQVVSPNFVNHALSWGPGPDLVYGFDCNS